MALPPQRSDAMQIVGILNILNLLWEIFIDENSLVNSVTNTSPRTCSQTRLPSTPTAFFAQSSHNSIASNGKPAIAVCILSGAHNLSQKFICQQRPIHIKSDLTHKYFDPIFSPSPFFVSTWTFGDTAGVLPCSFVATRGITRDIMWWLHHLRQTCRSKEHLHNVILLWSRTFPF